MTDKTSLETKQQRASQANLLIAQIASCGRRFFYNQRDNRTAHMEVDQRGHIWFVDDYREARIYTHYTGRWRGFTHGGTLRQLVELMRDYISTGAKIPLGYIAMKNIGGGENVWGYENSEAQLLRRLCAKLPIIEVKE